MPLQAQGSGPVLVPVAARPRDGQVERDPDPASPAALAERAHDRAVREQDVMGRAQRTLPVGGAGRLRPDRIAEERRHVGLVVRRPVLDEAVRGRRTRARRTRRSARRCRAPPSRPRPRAPAAGPSGRASRAERRLARAAPRAGGGRSPTRAGSPARARPAGSGATRPRSGRRAGPREAIRSRSSCQR